MARIRKIFLTILAFSMSITAFAFSSCGEKTNASGSPQEEQSSVSDSVQEEDSDVSVSDSVQEEDSNSADSDFVTEGVEYAVSDDGTYASVIAYSGQATRVRIVSTYEGVPVTEIATYAFYDYDELTEIIIPQSVHTIGWSAFSAESNLTKITLPFIGAKKDGTENVHFGYIFGANDYTENKSFVPKTLREVCITDSTYIGDYAFRECENITHIVLPDTLTTVGYGTFHTCSSLQKIVIPRGVTSFGNYSFAYCYNATICCEVEEKPRAWDVMWNYGYPVIWDYTGEK